MDKQKEDRLIELNLIVTNSFITESEQYTNFPLEFEGVIVPNVVIIPWKQENIILQKYKKD